MWWKSYTTKRNSLNTELYHKILSIALKIMECVHKLQKSQNAYYKYKHDYRNHLGNTPANRV